MVWFDRFGQEWATGGLTDDPSDPQADAGFAFIGQAPPTVELFNSMFQWNDNKDNWLYGQIVNVILDAGLTPSSTDLTQLLQALNKKRKRLLTGNLNIYCDVVGGDDATADGTTAHKFKTIQAAITWTENNIDAAGYTVICNLAAGTYAPIALQIRAVNGDFLILGDPLNKTNYKIKNTNGPAVFCSLGGVVHLKGVAIEATGIDTGFNPQGFGLYAAIAGMITFEDIAFGPCSLGHMAATNGGQIWASQVNYDVYGGSQYHALSSNAGTITLVGSHPTLTGTPNFSTAFAVATAAVFAAWSMTFTGAATGVRAAVDANGVINLAGASPTTYFPGNAANTQARGGIFI